MKRILITGATGNVGASLIHFLFEQNSKNEIVAGVRDIEKAKSMFIDYPELNYINFDFENIDSFDDALDNIDLIFLLRPPHISDVDQFFLPLIQQIKKKGISQLVFLSVQGVEKSEIIPHNKIEKLILKFEIDYVFLRPSYFMQNLTSTLLSDIQKYHQIILPAGKAKFNWIDIFNIAELAAIVFDNFEHFKNSAIDITGYENENFYFPAKLMSKVIGYEVVYRNVNPLNFFILKKKEGMKTVMIIVMIMLHMLPRFQKEPLISKKYEEITGKKPTSLKEFIEREKNLFV